MLDRIKMKLDLTQGDYVISPRFTPVFYEQMDAIARVMYESYHLSPDYEDDTENDFIDEIAEVFQGLYGEFLPESSLVLEEDDTVKTGIFLCLFKDEPTITYIFTNPKYQNTGLAKEILETSCGILKQQGYKDLYLFLNLNNINAFNLFDSFGFDEIPISKPFINYID